MSRWLSVGLLVLLPALRAAEVDAVLREAQAAESQLDTPRALRLFHQADQLQPDNAFILQKIARQYSDLVPEQATVVQKRQLAQTALEYAQRATALDPTDPVNVLSLAVCHGKLAVYSDTRTKIAYSRQVREEAERALQLNPRYAWAHHVLGRWHYEVATLGATSRLFVRLLYGGLPDASLAEAIRHLRLAVELEPDELNHVLELGFAYAASGQPALARSEWQRGLAMPSRGKHDEPAKQRAREALRASD
jgi:tetratricopeptide (TPR) repeat protein